MSNYIVREMGKQDGYVMHDIVRDGELVHEHVIYTRIESLLRPCMQVGDTYQEVFPSGSFALLSYEQVCASWDRDHAWDRGAV